MLAGCSSSALLSPRHRLRSEPPPPVAQFQPCNYPMNTQRFDLACSSTRKEASRSHPIRPVTISVDNQIEPNRAGGGCRSLKQSIRLPPLATGAPVIPSGDGFREKTKSKSLKRFAEEIPVDDVSRSKRKKADDLENGGRDGFWFSQGFESPPVDDVSISKRKKRADQKSEALENGERDGFWFSQGFESPAVPFSLTHTSGEDESVCFVPSEVITNPNWFQTIVNEIAEVGKVNDIHEPSDSPSLEGHSSGFTRNESNVPATHHQIVTAPSRGEGGSAVNRPLPREYDESVVEHNGFELISLLAACVEAIGSKNIAETNHLISRLGELASPRGSAITRLVAYYTEALALRVSRIWPQIFNFSPPRGCDRVFDDDSGSALRFLNQITPIPRFIHFTSNEILLRAFDGEDRIHVIDLDVKQGLQWPSFLQSLASRTNPPSHVRITGVGESKLELNETGDRLAGFADALNIPFEFHPVVDRLEDVRLWMLHVKENETVAINCAFQIHKLLYDVNGGALTDFFRLIRSTNPSIVVITEQESNTNGENLEKRIVNSLKHYSALFDSIDLSLPLESAARVRIEEMLAREIKNIVACEGSDRIERHEEYESWKSTMERGGFRNMGIDEREAMHSEMLMRMYCCEGFRVERRGGEALTLSFSDQPLYTVSAWSPGRSSPVNRIS